MEAARRMTTRTVTSLRTTRDHPTSSSKRSSRVSWVLLLSLSLLLMMPAYWYRDDCETSWVDPYHLLCCLEDDVNVMTTTAIDENQLICFS